MATLLDLPLREIGAFCNRWGITELSVFGSAVRGELTPQSDMDFLVTWSDERHLSLADHEAMEEELERIVGRRVDLVSRRAIEESENFVIRRHILASARRVYAA